MPGKGTAPFLSLFGQGIKSTGKPLAERFRRMNRELALQVTSHPIDPFLVATWAAKTVVIQDLDQSVHIKNR